jgi:predicted TIM-barrel fold metal-dependent hydrolase
LSGLKFPAEIFDDYLEFVDQTFRTARPELVGLKLLLGYHRPLQFQDPSFFDARDAYQRLRGDDLTPYRMFQDFMVRRLYQLAGTLDLPLQIHASFGGPSSGLHLAHNDPALLQSLFGQPGTSATRIVVLHGGYPYVSQAAALAWIYPRVYLDFSVLPSLFALPLARWLEEWLELLPRDKLLFGSDASAPELYYTAAVNGRRQLGRALDNLIASGGLNRAEAMQVAERVCFKNAATLYGLRDM